MIKKCKPYSKTKHWYVVEKVDKDKILFTKEELEELVLELTKEIVRIEFN